MLAQSYVRDSQWLEMLDTVAPSLETQPDSIVPQGLRGAMALEGLNAEQITAHEEELLKHVPQEWAIGNKALSAVLGWQSDSLYWDIRNRLIERGVLLQGRGRGGSVRRPVVVEAVKAESATPMEAAPNTGVAEPPAIRESDLYAPMAEVIRNRWAQDHRLDSLLVEVTALQGSKQTKGRWTRPDITVASYNTFPYIPGRHFDVITFEVKPASLLDITVVYEALGHRRASTRAYALLHIPEEEEKSLQAILEDICVEAKRHGVGIIVAAKPEDYETWEELVEAVRHDPEPERLNDFLAVQVSQGFREQIIKWFK